MVLVGFGSHSLATNITLLKAAEVDEISHGFDDKYKAVTFNEAPVVRYSVCWWMPKCLEGPPPFRCGLCTVCFPALTRMSFAVGGESRHAKGGFVHAVELTEVASFAGNFALSDLTHSGLCFCCKTKHQTGGWGASGRCRCFDTLWQLTPSVAREPSFFPALFVTICVRAWTRKTLQKFCSVQQRQCMLATEWCASFSTDFCCGWWPLESKCVGVMCLWPLCCSTPPSGDGLQYFTAESWRSRWNSYWIRRQIQSACSQLWILPT